VGVVTSIEVIYFTDEEAPEYLQKMATLAPSAGKWKEYSELDVNMHKADYTSRRAAMLVEWENLEWSAALAKAIALRAADVDEGGEAAPSQAKQARTESGRTEGGKPVQFRVSRLPGTNLLHQPQRQTVNPTHAAWARAMLPDDSQEEVPPSTHTYDVADIALCRRQNYRFPTHLMPCFPGNPANLVNIPVILDRLVETARLGVERSWVFVGMDGAMYLQTRTLVEKNDKYQNLAVLAAHGHEMWNYDKAWQVRQVDSSVKSSCPHPWLTPVGAPGARSQPIVMDLFGTGFLAAHSGVAPSLAMVKAFQYGGDTHKVVDWRKDVQHSLQVRSVRVARRFVSPARIVARTQRKFGIGPSFKDHVLSPVPKRYDSQLLHRCTQHA
jgi:hypothetical protein